MRRPACQVCLEPMAGKRGICERCKELSAVLARVHHEPDRDERREVAERWDRLRARFGTLEES